MKTTIIISHPDLPCHLGTFSAGGYGGIASTAGYVKDTIIKRDVAQFYQVGRNRKKKNSNFVVGSQTPGILWLRQ